MSKIYRWSDLENDLTGCLFDQADYADIGNSQPQTGFSVTGQFVNSFPDDDL